MSLKYSIINKISGDASNNNSVVETAQPDTNNNPIHQELFDKLKRSFHVHAKKQYGYFDLETHPADNENPLPSLLNSYNQENTSFADLNQAITRHLNKQFNLIPQNDDYEYYLWVVTSEVSTRNEIYLFLLKHEENPQISPSLTVEQSYGIHPEKLQYAAKIDMREWFKSQTKTYLSFLSLKPSDPATTVFNTFIGFAEGINRAAQTQAFLGVVEQYADNLPEDDGCRQRLVDYCLEQERQGDPIEVRELSRQLNEKDPDAFMYYLADQLEQPPSEIYPDRNSLKRYTRLYGRDQDISISFSTAMVGSKVVYDERSDTLTIRSIPKSLKSQLKRFLKS